MNYLGTAPGGIICSRRSKPTGLPGAPLPAGRPPAPSAPKFTEVNHEGYCGAVIAPPGVYGAHQYSTTMNYLEKIVPDALAVTNNRPAVGLILIGANDIGRGRDPYYTATNALNFNFYTATNLAGAENWTPAAVPLVTNGSQVIVSQAPAASATFFRLQWP
jgi:hypothetical protein